MNKSYNRKHYFKKQKALGVALLLLGILAAIVLDGDITVALLVAPLGLYAILTKKMLITDQYYYAVKHSEKMRNRRP